MEMSVDYLRVSVTDDCNLRCIYCNPEGRRAACGLEAALSSDELQRVVGLCVQCGIRRVRLTGGEPLLRDDIVDLVRRFAGIPAIEELSLTTNGVLLAPLAAMLKEAGLRRVNISLDAAEPACFQQMAGRDALDAVLGGIHKAINVGLSPVRINCVVMRHANLSQVLGLTEMTMHLPVAVRFIEYCPTSRSTGPADSYVPNREVRQLIESRFGALSDMVPPATGGPATYARVSGAIGTVGFISGRSSVFCRECRRLRLTSDGRFKPCLYADRSYDVRRLLRAGAADATICNLIERVVQEKGRYTKLGSSAGEFLMQHIGG